MRNEKNIFNDNNLFDESSTVNQKNIMWINQNLC